MLLKYKNELLQTLKRSRFDENDFTYTNKKIKNFNAFIIKYRPSKLLFMIRTNNENYHEMDCRYVRFAPLYPLSGYYPDGANHYEDSDTHEDDPDNCFGYRWLDFTGVRDIFHEWLDHDITEFIDEFKAIDLWAQMQSEHLLNPDPLSNTNNVEFTQEERKHVLNSISTFKNLLISEYEPDEEQLEVIQERLDYLIEAVDRVGKTDWQGIAISAVLSISIALSLDTSRGNALFSLFKQSFVTAISFFK